MGGFVAVYLIACLNAASHAGCTRLAVTDSTQAQTDTAPITMAGCLGAEGQYTAIKYWTDHPDLKKQFQYGGWACRIGNKPAQERGQA